MSDAALAGLSGGDPDNNPLAPYFDQLHQLHGFVDRDRDYRDRPAPQPFVPVPVTNTAMYNERTGNWDRQPAPDYGSTDAGTPQPKPSQNPLQAAAPPALINDDRALHLQDVIESAKRTLGAEAWTPEGRQLITDFGRKWGGPLGESMARYLLLPAGDLAAKGVTGFGEGWNLATKGVHDIGADIHPAVGDLAAQYMESAGMTGAPHVSLVPHALERSGRGPVTEPGIESPHERPAEPVPDQAPGPVAGPEATGQGRAASGGEHAEAPPETYAGRSLTPSEKLVSAPTVTIHEAQRQIPGASAPAYHEFDPALGAQDFHDAVAGAKAAHPSGAQVELKNPADYANMRLFTTPDRDAGFALDGDNIVSVFKHPDSPITKASRSAMDLAVQQGGRRLDAFDTFLPHVYSQNGFRVVARLPWSDEHAPEGWDYKANEKFNGGRPDVVFMVHDPAHKELYQPGEGKRVDTYEQGEQAQRDALTANDNQRQQQPNALQRLLADTRGGGPNPFLRQPTNRHPSEPLVEYGPHEPAVLTAREKAQFDNPPNSKVHEAHYVMPEGQLLGTGDHDHSYIAGTLGYGVGEDGIHRFKSDTGAVRLNNPVLREGHPDVTIGPRRPTQQQVDQIARYTDKKGGATIADGSTGRLQQVRIGDQARAFLQPAQGFIDQLRKLWQDKKGGGPNPLEMLGQRFRKKTDKEPAPGDEVRASTSLPFSKTLDHDPHTVQPPRMVGYDEYKAGGTGPGSQFETNANRIIDKYGDTVKLDGKTDPHEVHEAFINHVRDNLLHIWNSVPKAIRERSKLWYVGANKIAHDWANELGHTPAQIAGVMAALSPRMDWFKNVAQARRVLDFHRDHIAGGAKADDVFSPEAEAQGRGLVERARAKADASEAAAEGLTGKALQTALRGAQKSRDGAQLISDALDRISGKRYQDLTDTRDKAFWLRFHDDVHHDLSHHEITPEGDFTDLVRNKGKGDQPGERNTGSPTSSAFVTTDGIRKALNIIDNGDLGNISRNLGNAHKVRNFYNNIVAPHSKWGDVTIDTHAIAAGLLKPLGQNAWQVTEGLGQGGSSSAATGSLGFYPLYAEAYRRAAEKAKVLPREMQSVTWEGLRGIFDPSQKRNPALEREIDGIWKDYAEGRIDAKDARQQSYRAAGLDPKGAPRTPPWGRPNR